MKLCVTDPSVATTTAGRDLGGSPRFATGHPITHRWPDWEFGRLGDGRRYARRGIIWVFGPTLGYLDRVLTCDYSLDRSFAPAAWEVAA